MGETKDELDLDAYIKSQLSSDQRQSKRMLELAVQCRSIMRRCTQVLPDNNDTADDFWQKATRDLLNIMSQGDPTLFKETGPRVCKLLDRLRNIEKKQRTRHLLTLEHVSRPATAVNMDRVTQILGKNPSQYIRTSHPTPDIVCITRIDDERIGFHIIEPVSQHIFAHYSLFYGSVQFSLLSILHQLDPHNALDTPLYTGAKDDNMASFPRDAIVRRQLRPNLYASSSEHAQSSKDWYKETRKYRIAMINKTHDRATEQFAHHVRSARLGFLSHPIEFRLIPVTDCKYAQWGIVGTTMTAVDWEHVRIGSDYGVFTMDVF